jgi:hypothetical protein
MGNDGSARQLLSPAGHSIPRLETSPDFRLPNTGKADDAYAKYRLDTIAFVG